MDSTSILTTLGAGSGINMAQLAADLSAAQFAGRTDRLTAKSEQLTAQISAASTLKNALTTLASSLGDRVRVGDLSSTPSVANTSVAKASTPFGTFGRGSYTLEVTQLAEQQVVAGPTYTTANDVVGAGTLTIRFGKMDGTFTADPTKSPLAITIPSGSTLTDVSGAINAAGNGLSAYIAQTVDGPRLVIKGPEGEQNGFVIEATETVGEEGLAALAWEPVTGDPDALLNTSMDALFKVDGLEMESASNQTGAVAPGLQLQLTSTNIGAPTTITFSSPGTAVSSAMSDLVGALNEIAAGLKEVTDPTTGDLRTDPGARSLKRALSQLAGSVVMPNANSDDPRTLADLGLKTERDGTFTLDSARLTATMNRDPEGVAAMFTIGLFGVYATVDKLARDASSAGDANSLGGSLARYTRLSTETTEQVEKLAEKQESLRLQMVARFAKADAQVAASQATLTALQQQIDAWNGSNN